jgi:hypothetical protein
MDHDAEIRAMVGELTARFPTLPGATVDRLVRRLFAEFRDAPVQTYVPVLVRRAAQMTLRDVDHLPAGDDEETVRVRQPA